MPHSIYNNWQFCLYWPTVTRAHAPRHDIPDCEPIGRCQPRNRQVRLAYLADLELRDLQHVVDDRGTVYSAGLERFRTHSAAHEQMALNCANLPDMAKSATFAEKPWLARSAWVPAVPACIGRVRGTGADSVTTGPLRCSQKNAASQFDHGEHSMQQDATWQALRTHLSRCLSPPKGGKEDGQAHAVRRKQTQGAG